MGMEQDRFSIVYVVDRIGAPTPGQIARCLFDTGLCAPFELNDALAALVEDKVLAQTISANGLVYKCGEGAAAALADKAGLPGEKLAEMDRCLGELKARFDAEKDYIAEYTESSTGVVPVFLSIRKGARILLKVNLIVPDVETARVVTRNWMKNAHGAHEAVWESIGEGLPFPAFKPFKEGQR